MTHVSRIVMAESVCALDHYWNYGIISVTRYEAESRSDIIMKI